MAIYDNIEDIERAELYRLFGFLFFNEPSTEIIMQLQEMFQMEFTDSIQEIRDDFKDLFLYPNGKLMPYESLYVYPLNESSHLWGKSSAEVIDFYNLAGLSIDEEFELSPDHISVELIFMSYLIEKGLINLQKRFIEEHLSRWIPKFCDKLQTYSKTAFFKEIANILRDFVLFEADEFNINIKGD